MSNSLFYLSIIITGRNDNYGGDFMQRLQNFITWNTALLEKHQVKTEIIFVNWNPIAENPSIKDSIEWPMNRNFVTYKIITIPKSIHNNFDDERIRKKVPLYEFTAKNTGIRRAEGKYILTTNADILIDENIIKKIAAKVLKPNTLYRANRFDFNEVKEKNGLQLKKIKENIKIIHLKGFSYFVKSKEYNFLLYLNLILINYFRVLYCVHSSKFEKILPVFNLDVIYDNYAQKFHSLCSGDFILTAKSNYFLLLAFEEETWISTHVDALFVAKSYYSQLKEKIFFAPIYHQDHNRRFDDSLKNEEYDSKKMFNFFKDSCRKMEKKDDFIAYNSDNWGLRDSILNEILI